MCPFCCLTTTRIAVVKNLKPRKGVLHRRRVACRRGTGPDPGNCGPNVSRKCVMVIHTPVIDAGDRGGMMHPTPLVAGKLAGGNNLPYLRNVRLVSFAVIYEETDLVALKTQLAYEHGSETPSKFGRNSLEDAVGGQTCVGRLLGHAFGKAHVCLARWM